MPCYSPLQAYFSEPVKGLREVKFSDSAARLFHLGFDPGEEYFALPCGKCIGCRLERSRQWAMRCMHEAQMYENNCFITLTYDDEHLPKDGSLNKKHFQDFIKRLRSKYVPQVPKYLDVTDREEWLLRYGIRFYHCGEYGEQLGRPHYHAILFNFDFSDREYWKSTNGQDLFISPTLTSLWGFGHCSVGSVTFESAAYVARYCTKLITGSAAEEHYQGKQPEYATMSRCPGIGRSWFDKYQSDAYPSDYLVVRGSKCKPPRYYDNVYFRDFPVDFEKIKERRVSRSKVHQRDNTCRRLKDREVCKLAQIKQLKRELEV